MYMYSRKAKQTHKQKGMGSVIAMTPTELVTDSQIYIQPQLVVIKVSSLALGDFVSFGI